MKKLRRTVVAAGSVVRRGAARCNLLKSGRVSSQARVSKRALKRVSKTAERVVDQLSEEEKLALIGLLIMLILRWAAVANPTARVVLLILAVITNVVLSSYLDVEASTSSGSWTGSWPRAR
jgi:hypothetical protein